MSEQNDDSQIDRSGDHSEASLVPKSTELVSNSSAADQPKKAAHAPKEIVLQRLTPHSSWDDPAFRSGPASEPSPDEDKIAAATESSDKRVLSLAAIVTLAAAVGAVGGSAATFGIGHFMAGKDAAVAAATQGQTLESAIARVNTEIAGLKTAAATQAAKLMKLSEVTDKLRVPESTGSIPAPASPAVPTVAQLARLPIVDGWVLRDVFDGVATVEGRQGIYEVLPGEPLPGVGRVDAIRRQDGRWVVVTSRGLIVAR